MLDSIRKMTPEERFKLVTIEICNEDLLQINHWIDLINKVSNTGLQLNMADMIGWFVDNTMDEDVRKCYEGL